MTGEEELLHRLALLVVVCPVRAPMQHSGGQKNLGTLGETPLRDNAERRDSANVLLAAPLSCRRWPRLCGSVSAAGAGL